MSDFFSYDEGAAKPAPQARPLRGILTELSSEDWDRFIGFTARRRYPPGAIVVRAGDADPALYFIASGEVELRAQEATKAAPVPAGLMARLRGSAPAPAAEGNSWHSLRRDGELFGLLSFLDGSPSAITATVTGRGPVELLMLTPEVLQQMSAWQPRIAMALLRDLGAHVAERLRALQPGE
jgi:CRP-like cAMP-binding protein